MITLVLIASVFIYVRFTQGVVAFIAKYGKTYKIAAIVCLSLLPFIDVLAGYVAYYSICLQKAGRFVYGKTSPPISVCIDDSGMPYGIYVYGLADHTQRFYLFNLVSSVYTNVEKTSGRSIAEKTGLNRYFVDDENVLRAQATLDMNCDYDYVEKEKKIFMLPVYVTTAVLTDHKNGTVYARDVDVKIQYLAINYIPYFNWLRWWDQHYTKYYNGDVYKFKHIITETAAL